MKKFLIVGLGNIGAQYDGTRHNIGFSILDQLTKKHDLTFEKVKLAYRAVCVHKGRQWVLIKPTTFMNRSGKALRHWALKENIPLENIMVITDDIHLPFGILRLKGKGSAGGHNGLKDVEAALNTPYYARLRFGVGQETKPFDQIDFVLGKWTATETEALEERKNQCVAAILSFGLQGIEKTMNAFNGS